MALPTDTKKTDLTFAPLTPGLGFHPFSDGLPYAPVAKTQTQKTSNYSTGSGATAAGLPTFAAPMRSPQTASAPSATVPRISVPVARTGYTPQSPQAPQSQLNRRAQQQQPAPQPSVTLDAKSLAALEPSFGLGYVIKRVAAFTLDSIFNIGLCLGALSVALWNQDLSPELLLNPGIILVASLFLCVFNWAITTAEEVAFGTSIGKRIFGLALNGSTSAVFLRAFFFLPSICFAGIGIAWGLFDRRKRCWHDLVVDLQPIEIAKL